MAGLLRPISKTSISNHVEIACFVVVVACTIVDFPMIGIILVSWCYQWHQVLDCIGGEDSIGTATGICWGRGYQWNQVKRINVCSLAGVDSVRCVYVIRDPCSDLTITGFVVLVRVEARFIR